MKIYAMSDQHGMLDRDVPPCDLLIIAGDNCPDRIGPFWARFSPEQQLAWFHQKWMAWRTRQPAKHCIVTWGNHDYCGLHVGPGTTEVNSTTSIVVDALVEHGGLKIWLSPWSKTFMDWAFMAPESALGAMFQAIPEGIDILVSHDPPYGYGDTGLDGETGIKGHYGSKAVLRAIERTKPRVVISGHFHDGFGVYNLDVDHVVEKHPVTHSVTIYNVAQAGGAMSQGTIYLPESRGAVEIIL